MEQDNLRSECESLQGNLKLPLLLSSVRSSMFSFNCDSPVFIVRVYVCMYVCMDGWMDGWMHACMHACMHGCMDA